jgi:transposase-like protein
MGKSQPIYNKEFKQQAVTRFETNEKSNTHIARDLDSSDSALSKACGEQGEMAFPGKGHQIPLEEEKRRLQRENEILRQERDILKSDEHLRVSSSVKFRFIHEHRQTFPILRLCHALDVSEQGYYNWRKRGKSQRKRDDEQLAARIEDAYHTHGGQYGSPRLHAELKAQGIHCSKKRIARLMQEQQLRAHKPKRKPRTTNS